MAGGNSTRKMPREGIEKILVRAVNWVGDAVMTLPALDALGEIFPHAHIVVLAKPWVAPVYEGRPAVRDVVIYRKDGGLLKGLGGLGSAIRQVRARKFDLAILFQNAFEAAFLAKAAGVPRRLGYDRDGRGMLLTDRVPVNTFKTGTHQVEYYLNLLRTAGWNAESRDPVMEAPGDARRSISGLLAGKGIGEDEMLVGLSPGAMFGDAKRWPEERFAAVGDMAAETWGARVLVMGSGKETRVCRAVETAMAGPCINLCGETSLDVAMAVIERCSMFVTNDSGLMHLAAALGVPTVAVFGSTDPVATGPRGPHTRIVRHPVECAPCLRASCPRDFRCMTAIEPIHVWNEMESLRAWCKTR
jgi:heptosyltransferase II